MSDLEDYQTTRRYILQVMNEAGLQVGNTLHELQARADPDTWARIEAYLKPGMLTGDQRIIELLVAIHYGCRMESDTSLQPGTELELCFFYGSQEAVPIRVELATVRWAKGQEFGVKFLRLQSHEEARLRHVIAELLGELPR